MIIVRITGGLGNQMFQYAFARALQAQGKNIILQWHSHRTKSKHNGWELDQVFAQPLSEKIRTANNRPLLNLRAWIMRKACRMREPSNMSFNFAFLNTQSGYLDGYWQTEKYFADIADTIRNDFRFKPLTGADNLQLQTVIASTPCVSVHVRRGDYIGHPELDGVCTPDYYRKALEEIDHRHPDCTPIVFSDDISYCRKLFAGQKDALYCDWNHRENSWMDMALMSHCTHHIIANSSFSWWGAWLGNREGTVISPGKWFSDTNQTRNEDVYPPQWKQV